MTTPTSYPTAHPAATDPTGGSPLRQYSVRQILAIWAAAALPMALLAWVLAPWLADRLAGPGQLAKSLLLCLTAGLAWQFVLVVALVAREQPTLRWSRLRAALWLHAPHSPRTGQRGGRVWLILLPLAVAFAAMQLIPAIPHPESRDLGVFLGSSAGHQFLSGNWSWFAVLVALAVFNTVLGEELLFRGLLLPRMNGAFGRGDWLANGVLFAAYHLSMPWVIPAALIDTFLFSYPTKRYRSALVGIAVHSSQSAFILAIALALVLG